MSEASIRPSLPQRVLLALGRGYQRTLSHVVPVRCRFHPSCSQYYLDAVSTHGCAKGVALALYRLLRCQPFSRGGYDPVPPKDGDPAPPRPPGTGAGADR